MTDACRRRVPSVLFLRSIQRNAGLESFLSCLRMHGSRL